jgi:hypothetical protein
MRWIRDLDRILRGEATSLPALRAGAINVSAGSLVGGLVGMGAIYGVCMASFTMFQGGDQWWLQMIASTLKVPALFLLTLLITFPSLYVFSALVGYRLSFRSLFRLLLAVLGVTMVVLASLGPIIAFFAVSTKSYSFMLLLNVAVFGASGVLGLIFLLQTLNRLHEVEAQADNPELPFLDAADDRPASRHGAVVFRCWLIVFGLVGMQMGWVLRPFLGHPSLPFTWFRARESSFFESVLHNLRHLLG